MLDRIFPLPSGARSITAAAVSSQVVSMPSTSIGESLSNLRLALIRKAEFWYVR